MFQGGGVKYIFINKYIGNPRQKDRKTERQKDRKTKKQKMLYPTPGTKHLTQSNSWNLYTYSLTTSQCQYYLPVNTMHENR